MLLEHGARLPVDERVGFLHVFDTLGAGHDDPDLLDDVESFVADITKGAYAEGYGFDSDYGEYRTFGDERWTVEMDDLLDRAGAAFLAGEATLARGAYRMLLEAVGRDDAESEPLATRATALVEAADTPGYLAGDPSLAALDATRRESLPDLDRVLPNLIAVLREIRPDGLRFGAQASRLLAEATERRPGSPTGSPRWPSPVMTVPRCSTPGATRGAPTRHCSGCCASSRWPPGSTAAMRCSP